MTQDDGRNLTGKRLQAYYRASAKGQFALLPARSAVLSVKETRLTDRDQAYALAIELMAEADRLWPAS